MANEEIERPEFDHRPKSEGGLNIKWLVTRVKVRDDAHRIQVVTIGRENTLPTKSVLLVGETGAGKSTLRNALLNHLLGVQFEDDFRYRLEDEIGSEEKKKTDTQTVFVTGYLIYHKPGMPYDCNFLIIDTPGFVEDDAEGQMYTLRKQMEFYIKDEKFGELQLNCLAFVIKATTNRKVDYVHNFMNEFETLFGKDTITVTNIIATFGIADTEELADLLRENKVQYSKMYRFENGFTFSKGKNEEMSKLFWENAKNGFREFVQNLMGSRFEWLHMTKEQITLKEEHEEALTLLKSNIKAKVNDMLARKSNTISLGKHKDIKEQNKNFETEKQIRYNEQVDSDKHAHNCKKCEKTCYSDCGNYIIFFSGCPTGKCEKCSCDLSNHKNEFKKYTEKSVTKKETNMKMKDEYYRAQEMINDLEESNKSLDISIQKASNAIQQLIGGILTLRRLINRFMRQAKLWPNVKFFHQIFQEIEKDMCRTANRNLVIDTLKDMENEILRNL